MVMLLEGRHIRFFVHKKLDLLSWYLGLYTKQSNYFYGPRSTASCFCWLRLNPSSLNPSYLMCHYDIKCIQKPNNRCIILIYHGNNVLCLQGTPWNTSEITIPLVHWYRKPANMPCRVCEMVHAPFTRCLWLLCNCISTDWLSRPAVSFQQARGADTMLGQHRTNIEWNWNSRGLLERSGTSGGCHF